VALEVVAQIAAGLTAIQKQHLVHRDIKPSNIIVCFEGDRIETVKIIDLGLAKGIAEESISTVGGFTGTPEYASPEQFAGVGTDIRSDLCSLGITLWEMLSGKLPFQGSPVDLMYQHQHAPLPEQKLENAPPPVIALLQILLAKDPGERFQDPVRFQKALTKVKEAIASASKLTAKDLRAVADQFPQQSPKKVSKNHAFHWLLAAAFGLAGLLLGLFFFSGRKGHFSTQEGAEASPIEKSIAVLPFESISVNKDDSYFADGVQDEILNNLAKIAQLKVISRTSVMQYRADAKRDLRQIAGALGVANVLEGTVRRDGNHVRVSTDLVDAHNDNTIWADSYDRDLTDIFAIQSEVAQKVAARLSAQLSLEEQKGIEAKPTNNLEAYDLYLQGKQLVTSATLQSREMETNSKAISLLEEATQKDPQFALAYCVIAKAHDYLYSDRFDHTPERRALGDAAVNEALRLRPDLSEVHLAEAHHLYFCYRDFERARVQIAIAAQGLPNDPDLLQLAALVDQAQGRWEKATAGLERAATLDPRNPDILNDLARNYACLRRYRDDERITNREIELEPNELGAPLQKVLIAFFEKADLKGVRAAYEALSSSIIDDRQVTAWRIYLATCARDFTAAEEILSRSPNEEVWFYGALVRRRILALWLEFLKGNHPTMEEFGQAREQLYREVQGDPTDAFLMTALALADVALGRKEESLQEAQRAMEMLPISKDAVRGPKTATSVTWVYSWADQPELAFDQLNILIKVPGWGLSYGDLKTNPGWDPLRKDPRFDKLLAQLAPKE
ncbi:MAG: protein kinase, partial [Verrucomicrobia bacterium]|nr:protein kinase [Verrucomicrobiota bacterium]